VASRVTRRHTTRVKVSSLRKVSGAPPHGFSSTDEGDPRTRSPSCAWLRSPGRWRTWCTGTLAADPLRIARATQKHVVPSRIWEDRVRMIPRVRNGAKTFQCGQAPLKRANRRPEALTDSALHRRVGRAGWLRTSMTAGVNPRPPDCESVSRSRPGNGRLRHQRWWHRIVLGRSAGRSEGKRKIRVVRCARVIT
jgi:hypothetical protein